MQIFNPPSNTGDLTSLAIRPEDTSLRNSFEMYSGDGNVILRIKTSGSYATLSTENGVFNINVNGNTSLTTYDWGLRTLCCYPFSYNVARNAQITSNQNDYDGLVVYGGKIIYINSDASRDITGLRVNGGTSVDGDFAYFINNGSNDIVFKHQSASSSASNRFLNSTGADITLSPNQCADLFYDGSISRWRVFKRN